ncbi:MAG: DUF1573 domain-containing protein [Bacteroidia bacterium]|nr:DUF1573 domain-containing protein [Bacteroidia bacterium]
MKEFLSLTVLLLLFSGCHRESSQNSNIPENGINTDVVNNPESASGSKGKQVPEITFETTEHDFGTMTEGEKVSYSFRFTNTGNADLVIRAAQGSCGCTVPEWPKEPVKPGQQGLLTVTFNSEGKVGIQNKSVTIISNTMPNTRMIYVKAEVLAADDKQ